MQQVRSPVKEQILEVATRLMEIRGYHRTALDDVLRESGAGKGNFYHHFHSKEDLGYAILDRLVRRFGIDAELVLASAVEATGLSDDELLAPVADGVPVTLAELVFGVTHEGAHDVGDLLDRRTRVGLVGVDRDLAVPAAERALALAGASRW